MGNPEVVDSQIANRDDVVLRRVDLRLIHREADHCQPFAGCEGVVKRVTELGTTDADYYLGKFLQNVLDTLYVAEVERLIPPDQQAPMPILVQAPYPSWAKPTYVDLIDSFWIDTKFPKRDLRGGFLGRPQRLAGDSTLLKLDAFAFQ